MNAMAQKAMLPKMGNCLTVTSAELRVVILASNSMSSIAQLQVRISPTHPFFFFSSSVA